MTPQRWSRICNRWLVIVLIPLILIAARIELGNWRNAVALLVFLSAGGVVSVFLTGCLIAFRRDIVDWLKGH